MDKEIREALEAVKRHSKGTADRVEQVREEVASYMNNQLPSLVAQSISNHFIANPLSSLPPSHERQTWREAILAVIDEVRPRQPPPPSAADLTGKIAAHIADETDRTLSKFTKKMEAAIDKAIKNIENNLLKRCDRLDEKMAGLVSTQGISEEQVQQRINAALAERPTQQGTGLSEEQVTERIEAALRRDRRTRAATEAPQEIVVCTSERRQATEPWMFKGDRTQDLRTWILACEDFFARNPQQWVQDRERIIYAIGRLETGSKAYSFGAFYRRAMDGIHGIPRVATHKYWTSFVTELKKRFLSTKEAAEALISSDQLKYKGDVDDFIMKFKEPNTFTGMNGEVLRGKIKTKIPLEWCRQIIHHLNKIWMRTGWIWWLR